MKLTLALLTLALVSCAMVPSSDRSPAAAPFSGREAAGIASDDQFLSMSNGSDGLVRGGGSIKFVIDLRDHQNPTRNNLSTATIHYVNGRFGEPNVPQSQKLHYYFVRANLKPTFDDGKDDFTAISDFNNSTYFSKDLSQRLFLVGTIQKYSATIHGTAKSFYGIQFYPQDLAHDDIIDFAVGKIKETFTVPGASLAFVAQGSQQTVDLKLPISDHFSIDELIAGQKFMIMNPGDVYGILRVKPTDPEDLTPIDIPVFDQLPLDLSVVAGAITFQIQDSGSHINLKSKERKTPDVVVLDPVFQKELIALDGKPVHLVAARDPNAPNPLFIETSIRDGNGTLTPLTEQMVETAYRNKVKSLPRIPLLVHKADNVRFYDEMCPEIMDCLDNFTYGGKATKLGFLAQSNVLAKNNPWVRSAGYKYRLSPMGFGVPLTMYQSFLAGNPGLKKKIDAFLDKENANVPITKEQFKQRSTERDAELADIRNDFYNAKIPADMLAKIKTAMDKLSADVQTEYGVQLKKVKVRSSANVEDIPDFDGAGLHDSFGAKVKKDKTWVDGPCTVVTSEDVETKEDMNPDSMTCAIKGVYGSLWNKRAVEERSYKNIDSSNAAMALAVVPSYNILKDQGFAKEGNSVIITRVINSHSIYGYTMSTQIGDSLVTNPTPGTQTEVAIATFDDSSGEVAYTYTQYAKPDAAQPAHTAPLYSAKRMDDVVRLVQHVEKAYCEAKTRLHVNRPKTDPKTGKRIDQRYDTNPESGGDCDYALVDVNKTKALDLEFKYLGDENNGHLLCKQVREFSGE